MRRAISHSAIALLLALAVTSSVAAEDSSAGPTDSTDEDAATAENPFFDAADDVLPPNTKPPPPPPARGGAFPIGVEPDVLVLGSDGEASVEIRVTPDSGPVKVFAVLGSVTEPEEAEPGVYRVSYSPPEQFLPQLDFVAATALVGGELVWAYAAVPLVGQGEAEIKTRKYANAVIHIRDKLYGPVKANRKGKAKIQVQVPPGTFFGYDGEGHEVDLHVPSTARTAIFSAVTEVDMNDPRSVPLFGVAVGPDGGLCEECVELEIWASSGSVENLEFLGDGAFTASYVAPDGGMGTAEIGAGLKGDTHPTAIVEIDIKPETAEVAPHPPPPPPPPLPPAEVPWISSALKVGFAWNFGSLRSFDASLDAGVRLPAIDGRLGLGLELGFSIAASNATSSGSTDQEFELDSITWVVPLAGSVWFRQPLTDALALLITAQGAGVLVDNSLQRNGGSEEHERGYHPGAGGALAL
ncbi:MAG: hypothetical protein JRF63_12895, partial [Deltaproteobacteria bacterium]|nr:hypothetical protein [Deltaproteobacteria bacterium]